ncbi:hypothetical protein [Devosia sediminis]|uniref:Uncharacterized protein n=1 Tax=Devosia sediminis TaxID=2798801 RepID=A0A934MLJ4_9HYPH|nr:hypothetical protein [Devosia sediminis]MBJ3784696.1 hypothetical protein [Devosia sediminis]
MAEPRDLHSPQVAKVDYLVDENGSRLDVPDGSGLKVAGEHEESVASTGPTNWVFYGMIAFAIIVAILFLLQMFSGAPGTDTEPGSPTAAPMVETPAEPTPVSPQ